MKKLDNRDKPSKTRPQTKKTGKPEIAQENTYSHSKTEKKSTKVKVGAGERHDEWMGKLS